MCDQDSVSCNILMETIKKKMINLHFEKQVWKELT